MEPIVIEQLPVNRRSLRLAIVTETYPPEVNGVALSLARLVEGLRERDHEVQLIRPRQGRQDRAQGEEGYAELLTGGVPIPRYPDLKMGLPAKGLLVRQWRVRRPDIVHIVTEGPLGWSALQAAEKLHIPTCSDFRTNFHAYSRHYGIGWLRKPIFAYLRKFHNRTHLTMVPTEQARAELDALGFRNLRVLSRGVDTRLFSPARRSEELRRRWGTPPGAPVVLHVGRLAAEKNLDALVAASERIRQAAPQSRFVLVGDGPEQARLRDRLPGAVFAGWQRGECLAEHYASADMFLFPSCTETFGNVTLEAMASGLPLVAFNYAAAAQHVLPGVHGYLAEVGRVDQFVALASELAAAHGANPEGFRAMGQRSRLAAEDLDWGAIVRKLEGLLYAMA